MIYVMLIKISKSFKGIHFFHISEIVDYNGSNGLNSSKDTMLGIDSLKGRILFSSLFTILLTLNTFQDTSDTRGVHRFFFPHTDQF